jgi:hypothetical protein
MWEVEWSEVKWSEVKWSEVELSENLWFSKCFFVVFVVAGCIVYVFTVVVSFIVVFLYCVYALFVCNLCYLFVVLLYYCHQVNCFPFISIVSDLFCQFIWVFYGGTMPFTSIFRKTLWYIPLIHNLWPVNVSHPVTLQWVYRNIIFTG